MTPLHLLALVAVFAVVRVAIGIRPGAAVVPGAAEMRNEPTARTVVREYLDAFIIAGLVALFLITFVVRTFFIPTGSMIPSLLVHDVLLVNEFEYRFAKPHAGDIVVFTPPVISPNDYIKRTIGLPGDRIRVHGGVKTTMSPSCGFAKRYSNSLTRSTSWTSSEGIIEPVGMKNVRTTNVMRKSATRPAMMKASRYSRTTVRAVGSLRISAAPGTTAAPGRMPIATRTTAKTATSASRCSGVIERRIRKRLSGQNRRKAWPVNDAFSPLR